MALAKHNHDRYGGVFMPQVADGRWSVEWTPELDENGIPLAAAELGNGDVDLAEQPEREVLWAPQ